MHTVIGNCRSRRDMSRDERPERRPARYLIDGCYGDGNVGDECLLQAVSRLIRSADPEARIAAFSSDPVLTEAETGLPAVAQCNPFSRNLYGSVCKGLLWCTIEQIRRCDVFVLGGGELFRDHVGPSATLGMFYRMRLARLLGKRVLALGVGVQPATTWWGRRVLRGALKDAESLVFRDPESLQVARKMAHRLPDAQWLPDLVFSLDWDRFRSVPNRSRQADSVLQIGVAVKTLPAGHCCAQSVNQQLPGVFVEALSRFAEQQPCTVSVLPFADADASVGEDLREKLRGRGVSVADPTPPRIEALRERLAALDCLVAVPLHASVFAFASGVPTLGLAYDLKITRLYQAFGVPGLCLPVTGLNADALQSSLADIVQRRSELSTHLMTASRQAAQRVRNALTGLLSPPVSCVSPNDSTPPPQQTPSVSVVIPAYRAAATICRAIDSVLAQTTPPAEILVVDDESPDDLASVLAPYGDRVKLIRQTRGGASAARNRGMESASGDLVAFLDADDQWTPDKLQRCVQAFLDYPKVGIVASRYVLRDPDEQTVRTAGPELDWCDRPIRASGPTLLEFAKATSTPTVMARRELLQQHRFDVALTTAEDRDLWLRLLAAGDAYFVSEPLCIVHLRGDSLSHGNIDVDCTCMLRVIDRYRHLLGPLNARRERSYVNFKWASGLPGGSRALGRWLRCVWLWPLPYSRNRTRCRFARLRALAAILRRWQVRA
jgi:polysaccharide pyruvyl transferase WcaK-like protein/glycosyltransferase involved in cell wall biosynthesis